MRFSWPCSPGQAHVKAHYTSVWTDIWNSKNDDEASTTCERLDSILRDRFDSSRPLQERILALSGEQASGSGGGGRSTDASATLREQSNTGNLDKQIEDALLRSKAYGTRPPQSHRESKLSNRWSMLTTSTNDTFYSALSSIRVPVAESEVTLCRIEVEGLDGAHLVAKSDNDPAAPDKHVPQSTYQRDTRQSSRPSSRKSEPVTKSIWARKSVLTLGLSRVFDPTDCSQMSS